VSAPRARNALALVTQEQGVRPGWRVAVQMGSMMNHATAQMNHKLAHS